MLCVAYMCTAVLSFVQKMLRACSGVLVHSGSRVANFTCQTLQCLEEKLLCSGSSVRQDAATVEGLLGRCHKQWNEGGTI